VTTTCYAGNANDDADTNRGWLLGHFMGDQTRNTDAVEIKWGLHPAGQRRDGWTDGEQRTTLLLLVSGTIPARPAPPQHHPSTARRLRRLGQRHRSLLASRGRLHRDHRPAGHYSGHPLAARPGDTDGTPALNDIETRSRRRAPNRGPSIRHTAAHGSNTTIGGYLRASATLPPLPCANAPVRAGRCARPLRPPPTTTTANNSRGHDDPEHDHHTDTATDNDTRRVPRRDQWPGRRQPQPATAQETCSELRLCSAVRIFFTYVKVGAALRIS
jgi:hypothetical protein